MIDTYRDQAGGNLSIVTANTFFSIMRKTKAAQEQKLCWEDGIKENISNIWTNTHTKSQSLCKISEQ